MARSIAFALFAGFCWTSALAQSPMEVAVDDGCGFEYLRNAKGSGWMAVVPDRSFSGTITTVNFVRRDLVTSTGERKPALELDMGGEVASNVFPFFMIRGAPLDWQKSAAVSWYPTGTYSEAGRPEPLGVLFPGERRTYAYDACDARPLTVYALGEASGSASQICLDNYSIHVELEDRPGAGQTLYSTRRICGSDLPELLWAGDLDRDEVADLLLRLPVDPKSFDVRLYLSHSGGNGKVFGKPLTRRVARCVSED